MRNEDTMESYCGYNGPPFLGQVLFRSADKKEIEELKTQVAELQETVDVYEASIREKDGQIAEKERELKQNSSNLERVQGRYEQVSAELGELKKERTVPVYYCNHNESSLVGKIRAMLYCCYGIGDDNSCEHGIIVSPETVEMVNTWFGGLDELVGYTNIEYEEYIWETWSDEQIEKYYEELDAGGINLYNAIIANLDAGQPIREAMLNAMHDTDYGAISIVTPGK